MSCGQALGEVIPSGAEDASAQRPQLPPAACSYSSSRGDAALNPTRGETLQEGDAAAQMGTGAEAAAR
jgi:hypothetical protein